MAIIEDATMTPDLAAALTATGQPEAGFRALETAMQEAIGFRLFTIMQHDGTFNRRVYSNRADAYPLGGAKPMRDIGWMRRVKSGMPSISTGEAEIRENFTDHAMIRSLGCSTSLNLPVYWDARLLGVLNLLGRPRPYDAADAALGMQFAALAIPGLMA